MVKKSTEITINEARAEYRYSRQQLYNLIERGAVASRKIGWQHFIDRKSLEKYIATEGRVTRGRALAEVGHGKEA
jgi:hypothetical protein